MKKIAAIIINLGVFFSAKAQNCPTITLTSPYEITAGDTLVMAADVKGTNSKITYNWSVSAGFIESGQGTRMIRINTGGLDGMTVTATVEIGGIPSGCASSSSATASIIEGAKIILSGNYTTAQALTAAVKELIQKMDLAGINTYNTAFIYIYGGAATTTAQLKSIEAILVKAFDDNSVYPFQYKVVNGGKKKKAYYEMYSVPQGAAEPRPSK